MGTPCLFGLVFYKVSLKSPRVMDADECLLKLRAGDLYVKLLKSEGKRKDCEIHQAQAYIHDLERKLSLTEAVITQLKRDNRILSSQVQERIRRAR